MHRVIQFCRVTVGSPVYPPSTGSRHPSASPAPLKVCGPSGVTAHQIQPEPPPTLSQASRVDMLAVEIPSTGSRHPSASPAPLKVCGPSGVIIPAHPIQPEPPTRSQASSNLNFKFTFHPSWRPTSFIGLRPCSLIGPGRGTAAQPAESNIIGASDSVAIEIRCEWNPVGPTPLGV